MKRTHAILPVLFLSACSHFGMYHYKKAEWAPPEEAAQVRFADSMDGAVSVMGPSMAALKVAMDDYRPPSIDLDSLNTPEDKCLARWENIDMRVVQANENLFYVQFSPDPRRCNLEVILTDVGAVYAIDAKGRILARQ